jgi:uncharacterized protein
VAIPLKKGEKGNIMKIRRTGKLLLTMVVLFIFSTCLCGADKLSALIIDGQNNHDWKLTTPYLQAILESSGMFTVEVLTSPPSGEDLSAFSPDFRSFNVVVLNYNGDPWLDAAKDAFEQYVKNGGGLVIYHAADNSFPEWKEFNRMIGLGGWGERDEKDGPYLRWEDGKAVTDNSPGPAGSHGKRHEFIVDNRKPDHPILKGTAPRWKHTLDELYDSLRGPAENVTLLATAYSDPETGGTGKHEPILFTLDYGKGRVFHTVLGHDDVSCSGIGFMTTFARGAEWAATGEVTIPVPSDFPNDQEATSRNPLAEK